MINDFSPRACHIVTVFPPFPIGLKRWFIRQKELERRKKLFTFWRNKE